MSAGFYSVAFFSDAFDADLGDASTGHPGLASFLLLRGGNVSYPAPVTGSSSQSDALSVTSSSAQFSGIAAMAAGELYLYASNTATWIKQGTNPTASAAAGSMFVPAGAQVVIDGSLGAKLAAIRDSADGKASLTRIRPVR